MQFQNLQAVNDPNNDDAYVAEGRARKSSFLRAVQSTANITQLN